MKVVLQILVLVLIFGFDSFARAEMPKILSLKDQAQVIDRLLEEKVNTVLPELMRKNDIDLWIVMSSEYN
jgi:hypothetical protein